MSKTDHETLTPLEQHAHYLAQKETLLTRYKTLEADLEYAMDDVEQGRVKEKRTKLAKKIKTLASQIRDLASAEHLA